MCLSSAGSIYAGLLLWLQRNGPSELNTALSERVQGVLHLCVHVLMLTGRTRESKRIEKKQMLIHIKELKSFRSVARKAKLSCADWVENK